MKKIRDRPYKKKWVKIFRREIQAPENANELWELGKVRITLEIPWTWARERSKNKEN